MVVFSNGVSDTSIQEVTVAFPTIDLGPDITSCANVVNTLDATTPDATYLWSDNSTQNFININEKLTTHVPNIPRTINLLIHIP